MGRHSGIETKAAASYGGAGFEPLTSRLDRAAGVSGGMTFYTARGAVDRALGYGEIREAALVVAGRLLGRGLEPGDRVAIIAETAPGFVTTLMGCLYAGLAPCPAPMPAAFGARAAYLAQLDALIESAGARAVVAPGMFGDWLAELPGRDRLDFVGPLDALDNAPDLALAPAPGPADRAYLQFSSGTTRAPKGVAVSHGAMMTNIDAMAGHGIGVQPDDRGVNWLPWYHDMGLVGAVMFPIACGIDAHYITTRDFVVRPGLWPELMSRVKGTMSYAPSFGYELAARRARAAGDMDLSAWRIAGVGGDMVRVAALDAFAAAFGAAGFRKTSFHPSYGLAEATLGVTFPPPGRGVRTDRVDVDRLLVAGEAAPPVAGARGRDLVLCGRPLPGHAVEIRDDADRPLPEGRVGRILARGPSMMTGYFGDPAATADALDQDGWLKTGDVGYLRDGELVVTGRFKDMLIVHGRNVWLQDVEWTIESEVAGARPGGVAAFAATDDPGASEDERIVIVLECRTNDETERSEMRRRVREVARGAHGLEAQVALCQPRALPRTTSGKLMRRRARELFRAGELGE